VQVRLHELKDHVDVFEVAGGRRQHDVLDLNDVWEVRKGGTLLLLGGGGGVLAKQLLHSTTPAADQCAALALLHLLALAAARAPVRSSARSARTWVLQQPQQLDLPQDARRVRHVLKDVVDLLDRDLLGGGERDVAVSCELCVCVAGVVAAPTKPAVGGLLYVPNTRRHTPHTRRLNCNCNCNCTTTAIPPPTHTHARTFSPV
jgi:hypothetical protein